MCRWFAYVSDTEPCLLEDVLIRPAHALTKQVHDHYLPYLEHYEPDEDAKATEREISMRNRLFNTDGLGLVWYSDTRASFETDSPGLRPTQYRTLRQPLTDATFTSLCAHSSALAVFAHIRAASPFAALSEQNTHPFVFPGAATTSSGSLAGRYTFMHNGEVFGFAHIRREVLAAMSEDAASRVLGTTDSEHLGGLFFTYLAADKGAAAWDDIHPVEAMKAALEKAVDTLITIQKKVLPAKGVEFAPSSLNVAVTDGTQLLAMRFRNHETQHPPSLYVSTTAGPHLNRKYPGHPDGENKGNPNATKASADEHGKHVIVASEPSTYKEGDWELIPKNHFVVVGTDMNARKEPVNVAWQ